MYRQAEEISKPWLTLKGIYRKNRIC